MQEVSEKSSFLPEACPSSDSGGELELANYWLEQSIQNEILRGSKLREKKLKAQQKERPFNAAANNAQPPKPAKSVKSSCCNNRKPSPQSRDHNGFENIRKRARSNSPLQPNARTSSPMSQRTARSTNSRARPMCSMRISELAVPTKRQCLDTWRKKADVLPGFMINRLKEQVMDQKPVVQVSDAVHCFKYDKKSPAKRKINKDAMENRKLEENQIMSSVFGHRIAQKLNKPANITLNPRLEKISMIVTGEICSVMKDRQRLRTDNKTHEQMVKEISDKVTIWIADILEETSEKLLEEDLRVKKMNDRTPANDGELITLIGTMVYQDPELEEQEGPVLDILDDLVDNIVDLFEPPPSSVTEPSVTKETSEVPELKSSDVDLVKLRKDEANNFGNVSDYLSVSSEEDEYDYEGITTDAIDITKESSKLEALENDMEMSTMDDRPYLKPVDDDESIHKHLMKELNIMIDSKVFTIEEGNKNLENLESKRSESFLLPLPDINDNDSDAKISRDKETDDKKESLSASDSYKSMTSEKAVKDDEKEEAHNVLPTDEREKDDNIEPEVSEKKEQNSDVSDALEILSEELSEERNKKVKFSHDNIGILKEKEESEFLNSNKESSLLNTELLPLHATEPVKMEINFGPPNEHLLSDADDLWPEKLSPVGIKPSASVSKSITSLGKILESDEKSMLSPKDEETRDVTPQPPDNVETLNSFDNEVLPSDSENNDTNSLNPRLSDDFDKNDQKELIYLSEIGDPKQDLEAVKEIVLKQDDGFYDLKQVMVEVNKEEPIVHEFHDEYKVFNGSLEPEVEQSEVRRDPFEQENSMKEVSPKVLDMFKSEIIASNENKELKEVSPKVSGVFKSENEIDIQDEITELDKSMVKELKATIRTIKPDIAIKNYPSDQSFVSSMIIELQKYGDKLQDIVANSTRGQSKSDILPTPQSERSKSVSYTKSSRTSSKSQQRQSSANVMSPPSPTKFDYRVHPKSAPSWTRRGQGEPGGSRKRRGYTDTQPMNEREREMRQWCKDLDNILENLDKWKKWLEYITKYINTMKVKAELNKFTPNTKFAAYDRSKPSRSIEKEVALWTKLNQRAKGGLKLYPTNEDTRLKTSRVHGARSPVPAKYCVNCGCKKQMRRLSRSPTRK